MRGLTRALALCCGFALGACDPPPDVDCPVDDAGADVGVDAFACSTRLVIGPVNIAPYISGAPGIGVACSDYGEREFRVRVFDVGGGLFPEPHGLVAERVAGCSAESDYLDIGALPEGEYDVAIESVAANPGGAHLVVGADLIRAGPCTGDGAGPAFFCWPIRVTVPPCGLAVAPAALSCEDPTAACLEEP